MLPTLDANSVHCVVTSPPYYGLRDYGTAQWDGGDAGCDHARGLVPVAADDPGIRCSTLDGGKRTTTAQAEARSYRDICGKCGARRIDRQIGLEATPDEYLQTMVEVFRHIRRVLRDDGTCWVNLGSSYASGGKRPSQSLGGLRALACDSGDTAPLGSPVPDCAYPGRDGECPDGSPSHRERIADTDRQTSPAPPPDVMIVRGSELLASPDAAPSLLDALASTSLSSSANGLDACAPSDSASVFPSEPRTSSGDVQAFSRKSCDCGSCGICFAYSTMRCLQFKAKDLMLMPELVALALQADGWILRSQIVWAKPNPMPESVTDRPTSAYEMVYLLSKKPRYFYDADAVREDAEYGRRDTAGAWRGGAYVNQKPGQDNSVGTGLANSVTGKHPEAGRNLRNVWTIATAPYSEAHFATFPPELAERCIRAGTSERGCCAQCGKPWVRVTDTKLVPTRKASWTCVLDARDDAADRNDQGANRQKDGHLSGWRNDVTTTGWQPGCQCSPRRSFLVAESEDRTPCTVLDPFAGAGTTLLVADRLQRNAIGIELNAAYTEMAMERCRRDAPLFADLAPVPSEDAYDRDMRDLFATAAD